MPMSMPILTSMIQMCKNRFSKNAVYKALYNPKNEESKQRFENIQTLK